MVGKKSNRGGKGNRETNPTTRLEKPEKPKSKWLVGKNENKMKRGMREAER